MNRIFSFLKNMLGFLLAAVLCTTIPASAYVLTMNSSGQRLSWPAPVKPVFYVNWVNNSSLSYSNIFSMFTRSLMRWKNAGTAAIDFDYWQGSDSSAAPTTMGYDGRNAIFFSSQSSQKLSGGVLGVTSVISYVSSGTIIEADIELNDESFIFTTNPADTTATANHNRVFLENVATHEIGHAYGLSHSAVLQSTMVYLEYAAQAKLSCDDALAIGARYPKASFTQGRGNIQGTINNAAGTAIFGAHVVAISSARGTVVGSAITQPNGQFTISSVEPGNYFLMIEPFQSADPMASLCGGSSSGCFYGNINSHRVCSGAPFKRGFLEDSVGSPNPVTVTANTTTSAVNYTVSCTAMTGGSAGSSAFSAPAIISFNGGSPTVEARTMVIGGNGSDQYFKLEGVLGDIKVKVLAYSLYAPFNPSISLIEADGSGAVSGAVDNDDVFTNSSNYINYDASVSYSATSTSTYYIRVRNSGALSSVNYPAGTSLQQVDSTRFYILIASINEPTGLLPNAVSPIIANNARCEGADNFPAFTDHGPPSAITSIPSASASSSTSSGSSNSGCGWIAPQKDDHHSDSAQRNAMAFFSTWGMLSLFASLRFLQRLILAIKSNRH